MKILLVYYSRSGVTRKLAEMIAQKLRCRVEELKDTEDRDGIFGYLKSGFEAARRKLTFLEDLKEDPVKFDLVILGTPVWAGNMSVPIRAYIAENRHAFNKVAFFCTMGGSGEERTFMEMSKACKQVPCAMLSEKSSRVKNENLAEDIKNFIADLKLK